MLSSIIPLQIIAAGAIGVGAIAVLTKAAQYWDNRSMGHIQSHKIDQAMNPQVRSSKDANMHPPVQATTQTARRVLLRVPQKQT